MAARSILRSLLLHWRDRIARRLTSFSFDLIILFFRVNSFIHSHILIHIRVHSNQRDQASSTLTSVRCPDKSIFAVWKRTHSSTDIDPINLRFPPYSPHSRHTYTFIEHIPSHSPHSPPSPWKCLIQSCNFH